MILMTMMTVPFIAAGGAADDANQPVVWRQAVQSCLDNVIRHGTDRYGKVKTPMLMSIVDVRTNTSPQTPELLDGQIRAEGRPQRRNPGGSNLWTDQPLLRTLYAFSKITDDSRYAKAADDYVRYAFEHARKPNGMMAWGSHIFYDAYNDRRGGDGNGDGPHEILVHFAEWERMWRVTPERVRQEIEGIWRYHIVDPKTGEHNRHDDRQRGCDFAFSGGEFACAFAFLYTKTKDPKHLAWAKTVVGRHWNARNTQTGLTPDAPSTGGRYDAHHCFTTIPGPHAALVLKCYELTGDAFFKEVALTYLKAYVKHGWDAKARRFYAMLTLDGKPIMSQGSSSGYDAYKPTGHVEIWRTLMFSYEFPILTAQTYVYAYELTGDAELLDGAGKWAENIRAHLPPTVGRRWRKQILEAMPAVKTTNGTYAENYGRAISFFLHLHHATGEAAHLSTARALANEAAAKLSQNGWLKGHPAKPYYEATDGVSFLLYALLELSAHPKKLPSNL